MESAWDFVLAFPSIQTPSLCDYVRLDESMDNIRTETDMESRLVPAGYSQQFCRFKCDYDACTDRETLNHLKKHYNVRQRQLKKLQRLIADKEIKIQNTCKHKWERDWEARDHRSRYMCTMCGAYR